MEEQRLLEKAIGEPGRPITAEPFGAGRIAGFRVDQGEEAGDWFVDTSLQPVPVETGFVIRNRTGAVVARIWKHPFDPRLPALRTATNPERLRRIAGAAGSSGAIEARVLAYRPGRRAVVRLTQHGVHLFVKVVRPGEAEDLAAIHDACRAAGVPAPEVVHWSRAGVVVVRDAVGTPGPVAATRMPADAVLDAVETLREQFKRVQTSRIARPSVGTRLDWHIDRLASALPDRVEELRALRAALEPQLKRQGAAEVIHGDLHIGQLFCTDNAVSSVIDIDTAGLGDPCDDTAAFIGHATASAVRNEVAGRARDAELLHVLAETAADRWLSEPRTAALTTLHLIGHAIRAAERSREAAHLMLDEALDLQSIRRSR